MSDPIAIANQIPIHQAGLNEFWLQDQIFDKPSILGLGNLEALQRERRQLSGGRLDILLKDPADDTMYEVEVMLGETDETHIVRCIEYWDNEKRRWPQRQHCAVLVAENINRRFFNVIHLLSNAIPIIAIQASLVESNGVKSLFFTTVLDTYEEPDDGTGIEEQGSDRETWNKEAPWVAEAADAFLPIAGKIFGAPTLRYCKGNIGLWSNSHPRAWFRKLRNPKVRLVVRMAPSLHDEMETLLVSAGMAYARKTRAFRIDIDKQTIESKREAIENLMELVKRSADEKG